MLKEIQELRQENGDGHRRWFEDDCFCLIVWYDRTQQVRGFQLCYNKARDKHAFTWRRDRGYEHDRIGIGEELPVRNRAPVLFEDCIFPSEAIALQFEHHSQAMAPSVVELISRRLRDFPAQRKTIPSIA